MKVGQRLFIAVLPAVLGLVLVAALGYWGRYAHAVPGLVLIVAAVAAVLSLFIAWSNTRYVVSRVERLAGLRLPHTPGDPIDSRVAALDALRDLGIAGAGGVAQRGGDELDAIEATVTGLSSAVAIGREESARRERETVERERRFEGLLDVVTAHFAERTEEARLPLHILLSSPFGALNENQEEMLGAAQTAVDAVDTEVRQLQKLLQLHRGQLIMVPQPIGVAELLRPPLAIAAARAERSHVQLRPTLSDAMPRVVVDAVHAQEALTSILTNAVARTPEGSDLDVDVREVAERPLVRIRVELPRPQASPDSIEMRLAKQLIEAQHGTLTDGARGVVIELPIETASRVTR